MLKSTYKVMNFSQHEIALLYAIVKVSEIRILRRTESHMTLVAKIVKAKETTRNGARCLLNFSPEECSLMRQYNTNYCVLVSENVQGYEAAGNELMYEEGLEVYRIATNIQLRFSTIN